MIGHINIINIKLITSLLIFSLLLNGFMPKISISKSSKEMARQIISSNIEVLKICVSLVSPEKTIKTINKIIEKVLIINKSSNKRAPVKEKEKEEETEKATDYTTININKKTNKKSGISKNKNKLAKVVIIGVGISYAAVIEIISKAEETKAVKGGIRKIYYFLFARSSLGSLGSEGIVRNIITGNIYKNPGLDIKFNPGFFILK